MASHWRDFLLIAAEATFTLECWRDSCSSLCPYVVLLHICLCRATAVSFISLHTHDNSTVLLPHFNSISCQRDPQSSNDHLKNMNHPSPTTAKAGHKCSVGTASRFLCEDLRPCSGWWRQSNSQISGAMRSNKSNQSNQILGYTISQSILKQLQCSDAETVLVEHFERQNWCHLGDTVFIRWQKQDWTSLLILTFNSLQNIGVTSF